MSPPPRMQVIVLAAGASTRFGSDKLVADVSGKPLLTWTLEVVLDVVAARDVLVTVDELDGERAAIVARCGARAISVPDAEAGISRSIAAGLEACDRDTEGACIILADDPIAARELGAVLGIARTHPDQVAAVRRQSGAPHPVYLPRSTWHDATQSDGDRGMRALLNRDATWIESSEYDATDVDVPTDVLRLRERILDTFR